MAVKTSLVLDNRLEAVAAVSGFVRYAGVTPKRITLLMSVGGVVAGGGGVVTVKLSADDGVTLVTYDKLLTDTGTDAPVSSVTLANPSTDIASLSIEDVVKYIHVIFTPSGTPTPTNYVDLKIWALADYGS